MSQLHRKEGHRSQQGAALLVVLLLVASMSALAVIAQEHLRFALRFTGVNESRVQMEWHRRSAESLAVVALQRAYRDAGQQPLTGLERDFNAPFVFPIDGGRISAVVVDATNCFNLNNLLVADTQTSREKQPLVQFRDMLAAANVDAARAVELADALKDWIDADDVVSDYGAEDAWYASQTPAYRTAGGEISDASELRAVRGFGQDIYIAIRSLICARPRDVPMSVNINTVRPSQAALLAPVVTGHATADDLAAWIDKRPVGGFRSADEAWSIQPLSLVSPDLRNPALLSAHVSYVALEALIEHGDTVLPFRTVFRIAEGGRAAITRREGLEWRWR